MSQEIDTHEREGPSPDEGAYSIRAVQRVCDLLDVIQTDADGTSLIRAAQATGLPKSSVFRYLVTLEERRYVERDPDTGTYRLGLAFLPMHAQRLDVFMRHIRPYLERLRDQFGETANLGLLDRNAILYLDIVESPHAMRLAAKPGQRDRLHSTALGKAIAAHLSAERVREILKKEGMPQLTDSTITSQRKYLAAIADIRETGYALDDEENEVGARCVAVALPLGEPLLAISVSGPSARIRPDAVPAIATQLMKSAEQIASELNSVRELRP